MKRRSSGSSKNLTKIITESKSPDSGIAPNLPSETAKDQNAIVKTKKTYRKFLKREIQSLIAAVEARPVIWTTNGELLQSAIKEAWQEIYQELNIEDISLPALQGKWNQLRRSFKHYSEKLSVESLGHGASLRHRVDWEYFHRLIFLYDEDEYKDTDDLDFSSKEISYIKLEPEIEILGGSPAPNKPYTQEPEIEGVGNSHAPTNPQGSPTSISRSSSNLHLELSDEDCQSSKNQSIQGARSLSTCSSPTQTPFAVITSSTPTLKPCVVIHAAHNSSPQRSAESPLKSMESNQTFCNSLLTELRILTGARSRNLRNLLMKGMHEFIETKKQAQLERTEK